MTRFWLTLGLAIVGLVGGFALWLSMNMATDDSGQAFLAIVLGMVGGLASASAAGMLWQIWHRTPGPEDPDDAH